MISPADVEKIARLARLELTEQEKVTFSTQLDGIIGYINQLNSLDTSGIEPTAHAIEVNNVFRDDVHTPFADRDLILNNAPQQESDAFVVPKIV